MRAKNKIVIIEDVHERPHVVSRTLKHLYRIGLLDQAAAIIFGDFFTAAIGHTTEEKNRNEQALLKALQLFAANCSFPVFQTNRIGHGKINEPILFGAPASLQTGSNPKLTIQCL